MNYNLLLMQVPQVSTSTTILADDIWERRSTIHHRYHSWHLCLITAMAVVLKEGAMGALVRETIEAGALPQRKQGPVTFYEGTKFLTHHPCQLGQKILGTWSQTSLLVLQQ